MCRAQRITRSLLIFVRFMKANGWWSVSKANSVPYRYRCNRFVAQNNPRHSRSIVEYRVSVSLSFLLMSMTGILTPSYSCIRTAPKPPSDASVRKINCLWKSGSHRISLSVKVISSVSNALFDSSSQLITFVAPFLSLSVNGLAILA